MPISPRIDSTNEEIPIGSRVVLLAEDDEIAALGISEELAAAGFTVAGPFATCADMRRWLESGKPHAAILDLHLRDGPCLEDLRRLLDAGVPVVICTAGPILPPLVGLPVFEKPTDPRRLVRFLRTHGSSADE